MNSAKGPDRYIRLMLGGPDVGVRGPKLPCPLPGLVEHPQVQENQARDRQQIFFQCAASQRPPKCDGDVSRFPLVEFLLRRKVWDKCGQQVGVERRGAIRVFQFHSIISLRYPCP